MVRIAEVSWRLPECRKPTVLRLSDTRSLPETGVLAGCSAVCCRRSLGYPSGQRVAYVSPRRLMHLEQ
jgi:hypothetical protein